MGFAEGIFSNFKTMRRTGYTTNLAEMCKEKNCNLVVANKEQLDLLKQDFKDIKCVTLTQFEKLRGLNEPFYLDNTALVELLKSWEDAERNHDLLQIEHEELIKRNNLLFDEFIALRRQVVEQQEQNLLLARRLKDIEWLTHRSLFRKMWDSVKDFFRRLF